MNPCDRCDEFWKDRQPLIGVIYQCTECKSVVWVDDIVDQVIEEIRNVKLKTRKKKTKKKKRAQADL